MNYHFSYIHKYYFAETITIEFVIVLAHNISTVTFHCFYQVNDLTTNISYVVPWSEIPAITYVNQN